MEMQRMEENLDQKKSMTRILLAVTGLAALAAVAAWQFYLFVVFKDAQGVVDVQGGSIHLWLAIGIALIACLAGFFVFSRFVRHDARDEIHITSPGPPQNAGRISKGVL
jgi:hypothetical protein